MEKQELVSKYIQQVEDAIQCADSDTTKLTSVQFEMEGMSSKKNRIFLNQLLSVDSESINYLEIGTWKGSTFVSAMYENKVNSAIAIDNFSQFDGNLTAFSMNCLNSNIGNFSFINADCFNLDEKQLSSIKDVNIYFYDGDHRHEDQRDAITYYLDKLQDVFILIVDDWNHPPVKTGTREGYEQTGLIVHKEWELPAEFNGDRNNWWNGFYVAVCEKKS